MNYKVALSRKIYARTQGPTEHVSEFYHQLMGWCYDLNPHMMEEAKLGLLTDGVRPEILDAMATHRPETCAEFLELAKQIEETKNQVATRTIRANNKTVAAMITGKPMIPAQESKGQQPAADDETTPTEIHAQLSTLVGHLAKTLLPNKGRDRGFRGRASGFQPRQSVPPPNPEHASKVCYECENRGHIGRDCAIRKARQATQEKTKKPEEPPKQKNEKDAKLVGLISVDGKQDTDKFAKGTLIAMIRQENDEYVVHRINTGALVSKSVKCENVWVDALIDTGAGISVISPQLAERLQLATTGWMGSTIRKANGSKAEPAGKTTISITDGNNTATATVLVMKCSEDIDLLVGTDLLQQFGRVTINFENGTTNTRLGEAKADETEAFMIATLGSDSSRTKLVTRAVATIPPRTTVFVGSRTTKETRGIYMIEPNTNLLRTKAISW